MVAGTQLSDSIQERFRLFKSGNYGTIRTEKPSQ